MAQRRQATWSGHLETGFDARWGVRAGIYSLVYARRLLGRTRGRRAHRSASTRAMWPRLEPVLPDGGEARCTVLENSRGFQRFQRFQRVPEDSRGCGGRPTRSLAATRSWRLRGRGCGGLSPRPGEKIFARKIVLVISDNEPINSSVTTWVANHGTVGKVRGS